MTARAKSGLGLLGVTLVLAMAPAAAAQDHRGMVYIPAGPFIMGANATDGRVGLEVGVDSLPRHTRQVAAFWIDRTEVTHAQYRDFISATGRPAPVDPKFADFYHWKAGNYPEGTEKHPVVYVDWNDADSYCRWRGKRLPTEAEWEKAARGTDGRRYPWGDTFEADYCNTRELGLGWSTPVGTLEHDRSPYGVMDMCGNVSEWTGSWYQGYPGTTLVRRSFGKTLKVVRGGSWLLGQEPFARVTNRTMAFRLEKRHRAIGFRCAADAAPGDGGG